MISTQYLMPVAGDPAPTLMAIHPSISNRSRAGQYSPINFNVAQPMLVLFICKILSLVQVFARKVPPVSEIRRQLFRSE